MSNARNADKAQKRRWLRIHLSTLVVVAFVAGGVISLSCRPGFWGAVYHPSPSERISGVLPEDSRLVLYGWPVWFLAQHRSNAHLDWTDSDTVLFERDWIGQIQIWAILIDLFVLAVILIFTTVILEYIIHRAHRN